RRDALPRRQPTWLAPGRAGRRRGTYATLGDAKRARGQHGARKRHMSEANGSAGPGMKLRRGALRPGKRGAEALRLARLGRERQLPEPVLAYGGFTAVWIEYDLALLVLTGDAEKDIRRANRAAADGWLLVLATPAGWQDGTALDAVKRVAKTC